MADERLTEAEQAPTEQPPETETEPKPRIERVLVVSAHPDDPEFGSGATIAKLAQEGAEVYYCICTDGSQGGEDPSVPDQELTRRRYAEQRDAAAVLGVKEVCFLGFRDGSLAPTVELRRAITAEIRRRKPDLVITHSPNRALATQGIGASHPDHLAVGEATLSAVYPDARNPRAYSEQLLRGLEPHKVREVWVNAIDVSDHFVEISEQLLETKLKAIMCHRSQFEKPDVDPDAPAKWIRERMKRIGEKAGYEYAEGFKRLETA
ncbi:MAG TPA: PIG-L deacetylase family protein [Candidatus Dormibacteraeota bacterium]